jgi:hypothetical protein
METKLLFEVSIYERSRLLRFTHAGSNIVHVSAHCIGRQLLRPRKSPQQRVFSPPRAGCLPKICEIGLVDGKQVTTCGPFD